MIGPAIGVAIAAAVATLAFHMVRPNFRELRLSVSRFLPDLPRSQAPRNRFALSLPMRSLPFLLRSGVMLSGLLALANTLPGAPPDRATASGLRIVIDVSSSMAVPGDEGSGPPASRLDLAHEAALAAHHAFLARAQPPNGPGSEVEVACIEVITAGAEIRSIGRYDDASATDALVNALRQVVPEDAGSPVGRLLQALSRPSEIECAASHALVISDRARPATDSGFPGLLLWHQIGQPVPNTAISGARLKGGGLVGEVAEVEIAIQTYGADPGEIVLSVLRDGAPLRPRLVRDPSRSGGWLAAVPAEDGGRLDISVAPEGAFKGDDRITLDIPDMSGLHVDWRLDTPSPILGLSGRALGEGSVDGTRSILVVPYGDASFDHDGPILALYPGWQAREGATIGPFVQDHPLLAGLDFDVFEANAPATALELPEGAAMVIRPSGASESAFWIAARDGPRIAVVPEPLRTGDANRRNMSILLFLNALAWVAAEDAQSPLFVSYLGPNVEPFPNPLMESDTAAAATRLPDYALFEMAPEALPRDAGSAGTDGNTLDEATAGPQPGPAVIDPVKPIAAWLIAATLVLILAERSFGLIWTRRRQP